MVYPALLAAPEESFAAAEAAHVRRVLPLVVLVYGLMAVGAGSVVLAGDWSAATAIAVIAILMTYVTTALVAGPVHQRFATSGRQDELVQRLRRADRSRLLWALVAVVAAGWAAALG